jgi:ATP-dependent phosphoenolpyruvate carboxykinase
MKSIKYASQWLNQLMNDNTKSITTKCLMQLEEMDIRLGKIHRNLSVPSLIEVAIHRKEGDFSSTGALSAKTGKFTGRSPDDRYIVDDNITHNTVAWGKINVPISQQKFEKIFHRMKKYVEGREFFVFDGYVGADTEIRIPIRVITDKAWHSLFATQIFIRPTMMELENDEHGWSDKGIFNFEGGCYAKCINLKKENEPEIWKAIRFGAVMENVIIKRDTREPDFADGSLTENTRVVYPIEFIPGAIIPGVAGHPKVIVFLTADAFGVMPPIAKLTEEGSMYHFMSGYTSKLAGTERGITEPKETFSQCFGAPFMPLHAQEYAKMLGKKIAEHNTKVYLINTGWSGGPYGIGKRMNLKYTRAMGKSGFERRPGENTV